MKEGAQSTILRNFVLKQKNNQKERHGTKFLSVCLRLAELYASRAYLYVDDNVSAERRTLMKQES